MPTLSATTLRVICGYVRASLISKSFADVRNPGTPLLLFFG
jgi:hypothetical protein